MIFTKTSIYKKYKYPIDCNKMFKDDQRILGDNKTFIGFISMIICCIITQVLCGIICNLFQINHVHDVYLIHDNNLFFNIWFGAVTGFTYMLFELPNSFIKRRIGINPGETNKNFVGLLFFIIDQIDSLVGVMALLLIFANISFTKYINYIILGALTHVVINLILLLLKVRKHL